MHRQMALARYSMPMLGAAQRALGRALEPVLQRNAEAIAKARADEQQRALAFLTEAARVRADAAAELREPDRIPAALVLYREACTLLIAALEAALTGAVVEQHLPPLAWERLRALVAAGSLAPLPPELSDSEQVLAHADSLIADRLSPEERERALASAEATCAWLQSHFDPRSPGQVRASRWRRLGFLALLLVSLLVGAMVWALQPENLALNRAVAVSSQRRGSPNPQKVVDGIKTGRFDFHSELDDDPWLRIDLEARRRVSRVVVHNRGDGYFDEVLPLVLEVSDDAKRWVEVGVRRKRFTEVDPWVIHLQGTETRYLRLRKIGRGHLWLSEVEVF